MSAAPTTFYSKVTTGLNRALDPKTKWTDKVSPTIRKLPLSVCFSSACLSFSGPVFGHNLLDSSAYWFHYRCHLGSFSSQGIRCHSFVIWKKNFWYSKVWTSLLNVGNSRKVWSCECNSNLSVLVHIPKSWWGWVWWHVGDFEGRFHDLV